MLGVVLTVQIGKEAAFGGPGAWAFAPPDTPHTLANLTSSRSSCCVCSRRPAWNGAPNTCWPNKQVNHHPSGRPSNGKPHDRPP
jgi:hypothetical protein